MIVNLLQVGDGNLRVNAGGIEPFVPQKLLNQADVCPVFEHVGGTGVAK